MYIILCSQYQVAHPCGGVFRYSHGRGGGYLGLFLSTKRSRLLAQGIHLISFHFISFFYYLFLKNNVFINNKVCDSMLSSIAVQGTAQQGGKLVAMGDVTGSYHIHTYIHTCEFHVHKSFQALCLSWSCASLSQFRRPTSARPSTSCSREK